MANRVTVECPICHEDLEVSLTLINDSEGDGNFMHHFTTIDDYNVNWEGHEECYNTLSSAQDSTLDELDATIIQAGFNFIEAGDHHDIDPY